MVPAMTDFLRVEVDGVAVKPPVVTSMESRVGHFTAMQVRGGKTRGLALHLERLERGNRELLRAHFDGQQVLALIRKALGDTRDASVRVYMIEADPAPTVMVTVREPAGVTSPQRLRSVRYQRPNAHLKHLAAGQGPSRELAQREGFDDALLVGEGGIVAETSIANIGFFDGSGVVWPDAPQLDGITKQLLEATLPERGVTSRRATVRLRDLASLGGAFLSNARGVAAVSSIDDVDLPGSEQRAPSIAEIYGALPGDVIG